MAGFRGFIARGRAVTVGALVGCLVASSISSGGASAAPSEDVLEYTLVGPPIQTLSLGYGKGDGSIAIGANTERIVIVPTTEATTATVTCIFVTGYHDRHVASGEWTAEQWRDGEASFPVDPNQIEDFHPWVQCKSMPAQTQWEIGWSIDLVPIADDILTLTQDTDTQTYEQVVDRYADASPAKTVQPGDRVRVTGAPGAWASGAENPSFDNSSLRDSRDWWGVDIKDATMSADGSTVEFTIPVPENPAFFDDEPDTLQVAGNVILYDPVLPTLASATVWSARVLVASRQSRTTLALSNSVALSIQKVVATARVVVDGMPATTGTVLFTVDGTAVGTVAVSGGTDGKVSLKLPRLKRGSHTVTATYSGTPGVDESSRSAVLRILR